MWDENEINHHLDYGFNYWDLNNYNKIKMDILNCEFEENTSKIEMFKCN